MNSNVSKDDNRNQRKELGHDTCRKKEIYKLRIKGLGYKVIANEMQLSVDMVKGYCKRHHSSGPEEIVQSNEHATNTLCLQCKKPIRQNKRGRTKKFCSDACRYTWWNENQDKRSKSDAAIYQYTCQHCGRNFISYGDKHRKYCSHDCYIKARFWYEDDGLIANRLRA